ncbi:MAG: transcriptional regulator, TetR family [Nocardioidaceae bacterium]|nr:transcriptional regulator, TetR family [Nocardioidaceae bacterium]
MAVQSGVYRGVSAAERAAERRERLLEATLAVWSEAGAKVTMTAICANAGLTERYFYESFGSLDEALVAVLDAIAVEIEEVTHAAAERAGADPMARVQASVTAFVTLLSDDPRKGRVALVDSVAVPHLRQRRTELLRHFAHRSAEESLELAGLSRRTARDSEVAGLLFIGGMAELVTAWLDGAVEATPDDIVDAATRMFLGLYA